MLGLGTVSAGGRFFPALLRDDHVVDLSQRFASTDELLAGWDANLAGLESWSGPEHALADVEVHAPLRPRQVLQSGANYRQHVIDLAVDKQIGLRPGMSLEDLRE
jgi:hypothetical protein